MSSIIKNLLVFTGLILLGLAGYYLFVIERQSNIDVTMAGGVSNAQVESKNFLARLEELQSMTLKSAVFEDPRFRSLTSFSQAIKPASVGRTNPFTEGPTSVGQ